MLEMVAAYPDLETGPDAWRTAAQRRFTLRRLALGTFTLARTVALFPLVVLSWILLPIGRGVRAAVTSAWRLVTGTVSLVGSAFAAILRRIREAITAVTGLLTAVVTATARGCQDAVAYAGSLIAGATATVVLGTRTAVARTSHVLTHAVATSRSAAAAGTRRGVGAVRSAAEGSTALVARTAAALRRHTRNAVLETGRELTSVATTAGSAAASARHRASSALSTLAGFIARTGSATAHGGLVVVASATHTCTRAVVATHAATRGAVGASAVAGARVTRSLHRSSAAALQRAERPRVRMAVAGLPMWARQARLVPALAVGLAVVVATALGVTTLLLSPRPRAHVATTAQAPVQESTLPAVVLAVAPAKPAAALPVEPAVARRATRRTAVATAAVRTPASASTPAARAREKTAPTEARGSLSAARLRDIWSKTDTRSLDRGLTSLRSATLAFQRCELRRMSDDIAVAHCDEVPARTAWTIDFRRDGGRWVIDSLTSERKGQP
jgi:hypothetical protein